MPRSRRFNFKKMNKTNGSIITKDKDGNQVEEMLMTYSEEERQQNEINNSNAKLVFSPKFIPIYPELLDRLTITEALIFGFIDFYKSASSNRFYFTNEQLAQIVRCSPDTVSRAISKLKKNGFIKTSQKIRSGGGSIRFVTDILYKSDSTKTTSVTRTISTSYTRQKLQTNKNKKNKNKINNTVELNFNNEKDKSEYRRLIMIYGKPDVIQRFNIQSNAKAWLDGLIRKYGFKEVCRAHHLSNTTQADPVKTFWCVLNK